MKIYFVKILNVLHYNEFMQNEEAFIKRMVSIYDYWNIKMFLLHRNEFVQKKGNIS